MKTLLLLALLGTLAACNGQESKMESLICNDDTCGEDLSVVVKTKSKINITDHYIELLEDQKGHGNVRSKNGNQFDCDVFTSEGGQFPYDFFEGELYLTNITLEEQNWKRVGPDSKSLLGTWETETLDEVYSRKQKLKVTITENDIEIQKECVFLSRNSLMAQLRKL